MYTKLPHLALLEILPKSRRDLMEMGRRVALFSPRSSHPPSQPPILRISLIDICRGPIPLGQDPRHILTLFDIGDTNGHLWTLGDSYCIGFLIRPYFCLVCRYYLTVVCLFIFHFCTENSRQPCSPSQSSSFGVRLFKQRHWAWLVPIFIHLYKLFIDFL